ncbi:hypothetical protein KI387_010705, partial [Taxus chinensis]
VVMELDKIAAVNSTVAALQRQRWREKLPGVEIPQRLAARLSPLSLPQLQSFTTMLKNKDAASFSAEEFCSSANLLCRQDMAYKAAVGSQYSCSIHCRKGDAVENMHMFLDKNELRESGEITLPDLRSTITWKSFLPRELAELMPSVSTANLSHVLTLLNIRPESNVSRNMASSLELCEASREEGEVKSCITSVEDMVEFVLSVSGSEVELLTDPSTVGSGQTVKVRKSSRRENLKGSKLRVACHSFVYPYGLFYCHSFPGSDVFGLELEAVENEKRVIRNATAICHYFPNAGPGNDAACHLVF